MNTILITGFQKFGHYRQNATEVAIFDLYNIRSYHEGTPCSYQVDNLIFPVRIFSEATGYGRKIVKRAQEINAKAIISLGMSSCVEGLRIESLARNWVANEKYCLSHEHKRVIDDRFDSKFSLEVDLKRWNFDQFFSELSLENISHEKQISQNANSFCCNALMFRTLQAIQETDCQIPYLFIHVPCTPHAVRGMPKNTRKNSMTSIPKIRKIISIISRCTS
jgi:pyrrolidone-carboxylate peptidase